MCASGIVKVLFNIGLILGFGCLVVSIFTPWWRNLNVKDEAGQVVKDGTKSDFSFGILSIFCGKNVETSTANLSSICKRNFLDKPVWEQTAAVCMVASVGACLIAMIWSCLMCLNCCCLEKCLSPPLPIFTGLACVLATIGVSTYCIGSRNNPLDKDPSLKNYTVGTDFGVSMWFGATAAALLAVTTVLGIVYVRLIKSPLGNVV